MNPGANVENPLEWAKQQFGAAKLGDSRRTGRLVKLAADVAEHSGSSLPTACRGRSDLTEGAYRLIRNDHVKPGAIAASGFAATAKCIPESGTLLAIGDSSVLSYSHAVTDELGDIGGPEDSVARGIWAHSTLLVGAEDGEVIGLVDQQRWIRDEAEYGKKHNRDRRAPADKESFKWQLASKNVRTLLGAQVMKRVVAVNDRESDIYAYICDKVIHDERVLIRVCANRRILDEDKEAAALFDTLDASPVCGRMTVAVPQSGSRPARQARLTLRAASVHLRRPRQRVNGMPPLIAVNVLLVREENPPRGQKALEWRLMTTEPITTAQDIERVVKWYCRRWQIEVFHKVWKSGAGVERLRMQSAENLERMSVILAFVAVRMLQLRDLFSSGPNASCERVLSAEEWRLLWILVEKKKPSSKAPTIQWAYRALGKLGGWGDTKRTGVVGWRALWTGWFTLQSHKDALQLVGQLREKM